MQTALWMSRKRKSAALRTLQRARPARMAMRMRQTEMATNVRAANPVETTAAAAAAAAAKDAGGAAASSPTGGVGGFENSIMLELD